MNDKRSFRPGNGKAGSGRRGFRNVGFIALVVLFSLIIFAAMSQSATLQPIPISTAINNANAGDYQKIEVSGNELDITKKGDSQPTLKSYKDPNASLKDEGLTNKNVDVSYKPSSSGSSTWENIGISVLPVLLIGGLLFLMLRSAQGQGNQAMSFGKSRARLYGNEKDKLTFTDIAGSDEAKQYLQ